MPGTLAYKTSQHSPADGEMNPAIKRKPLPLSAEIVNTKRYSVHPTTRYEDDGDQTPTPSPAKPLLLPTFAQHDVNEPKSPFVFGDQLFPKIPYSEEKVSIDPLKAETPSHPITTDDDTDFAFQDAEVWRNDGDTVVSIGNNVELRIDSSTIIRSRYQALIDRLQELSDSDSADFTEAAPYSTVPIRYIVELPEPVRSDPVTYIISVRNFFAALKNKPIAGEDLVSELDQLHWTAVDLLGAQNQRDKATRFVRKYVQRLKLDDCRYMRTNAVRLLSWCERTKWEKGWIESFAHCVGMMGNGLEDSESFAELSERTRRLLHKSHSKQQQEIAALEEVFADFNIAGGASTVDLEHAGGLRAARAFQIFLKAHYTSKFGSWPPKTTIETENQQWLTRTIAQTLQEDFGGLYDFLVDDTVIQYMEGPVPYFLRINEDETLTQLESPSYGSHFPLEKVISGWNFKCGFEPIPFPLPLLPRFRSTSPITDPIGNKISLVTAVREKELDPAEEQHDLRQAYCEGIQSEGQPTLFARAFLDHEARTRLKGVSTHDARRGRWLVIYCMLQMLSRLAVDIQGLWYTNGVPYFLNCDLSGCPPWAGAKFPHTMRPSNVEDSWCWLYAKGSADARQRRKIGEVRNKRTPAPRYKVHWDEEGRWELGPLNPV